MSNCVGCQPGSSYGACDYGGNCGGHEYHATDYCHAVSGKDACRFPEPEESPLVVSWRSWWSASDDKTVKVNEHELGTVVEVREKDAMLRVEVASGTFLFPMRTTEVVG